MKSWKEIKKEIGFYEPKEVQKGVEETVIPLKEGDIFWEVTVSPGHFFDCKNQTEAEIISRLARIENILKEKLR